MQQKKRDFNKSLFLRAYETIRKAILDLEIPPNYHLREIELTEKLNMSRTPIREALQELKQEGLVVKIEGKYYVNILSLQEIKEIWELAEGVEGMAAYLAAEAANEKDLELMRQILKEMEAAIEKEDIDRWAKADIEYHHSLCQIARNTRIKKVMSRIHNEMNQIRVFLIQFTAKAEQSTREHRDVVKAISERDPERARHETEKHWVRIRRETMNFLSSHKFSILKDPNSAWFTAIKIKKRRW